MATYRAALRAVSCARNRMAPFLMEKPLKLLTESSVPRPGRLLVEETNFCNAPGAGRVEIIGDECDRVSRNPDVVRIDAGIEVAVRVSGQVHGRVDQFNRATV